YTGTHDNNTTLGWYQALDADTQLAVDDFLGWSKEPMPWPMIRTALASVAALAIIPMQDLLALDGQHRMNLPGTITGNWTRRFNWDMLPTDLGPRLRKLIAGYGRLV
ncbi:4-alpha-glucanotransferase, partial [Achromatium sp. WMS2]